MIATLWPIDTMYSTTPRADRSVSSAFMTSIRSLPPKLATISSGDIERKSSTLSATHHIFARCKKIGVEIVLSKSRKSALMQGDAGAAGAASSADITPEGSAERTKETEDVK